VKVGYLHGIRLYIFQKQIDIKRNIQPFVLNACYFGNPELVQLFFKSGLIYESEDFLFQCFKKAMHNNKLEVVDLSQKNLFGKITRYSSQMPHGCCQVSKL
jgi:hypothetical protein